MPIELGNFSTLFEIAAALNVAYIAVDYSTAYTVEVAKNVFRFHDRIDQGVLKCKSHIDEETIDSLSDLNINGHSILPKIEKVKRDSAKLKREAEKLTEDLKSSIKDKCRLECFSSICLHMFLYCIVASVAMGYGDSASAKVFWTIFCILSLIYTSTVFVCGEIRGRFINLFRNIRFNSGISIGLCVVSYLLNIFFQEQILPTIDTIWYCLVPSSALYPLMYFVLSILFLKKTSKTIYLEIDEKMDELEKRCINLEGEVQKLSLARELSLDVEGLDVNSENKPVPPQRQIPFKIKTKQSSKSERIVIRTLQPKNPKN